jgi:hypothetical protein
MFCHSPWSNIDFSPDGKLSPCCKFQTRHYTDTYNIQQHSVTQYANSNFLKQIKTEILSDQWPIGCERCRVEEQNSIQSKRQLDYLRWEENYKNYQLIDNNFITASIAFGNTCNLKCITCGPVSSSRWRNEAKDIYNVTIEHYKFFKNSFVQDFVHNTPAIIHIDIPGGEPFLSGVPEQQELLQYYIDAGQANNITLHYTTNATVFPDGKWWQLWTHFKEVDIQLSIDGVGDRYEYIRYPADWGQVVNNVNAYVNKQSLDNIRLSVSHTVSAYNIYYLDEFFTWCHQVGLPRPWLGKVHTPAHMRPEVWPDAVKRVIVTQLQSSKHADAHAWAELIQNCDGSEHFELFKTKLHQHDAYRNLDFSKTFPELAAFIR